MTTKPLARTRRWTGPAQFAAIRTDDEFNIIGEPEVFYCKPADDYLPQPGAVMVTGITPQEAREKGVNEAEFARRIHDLFTVPKYLRGRLQQHPLR
ncbi:exodeoxyribonuclease I [Enterobacter asburiae]|uniref:Exodeoxyribonuclease I n=1 Tax=Enterobacter asburiae TaxID=61645 RepID=A0A376FK08_ENTAS|nr:exodeoxyribonuclease I [Enterobacter asburiae]